MLTNQRVELWYPVTMTILGKSQVWRRISLPARLQEDWQAHVWEEMYAWLNALYASPPSP